MGKNKLCIEGAIPQNPNDKQINMLKDKLESLPLHKVLTQIVLENDLRIPLTKVLMRFTEKDKYRVKLRSVRAILYGNPKTIALAKEGYYE